MTKIIQYLFKKGLIDKKKLTDLAFKVKNSIKTEEEVLMEEKSIPEKEIFKAKSEFLKIEYREEAPEEINNDLLKIIPEDVAKLYKMIPVFKKKDIIEIGMIYPTDLDSQEALKFLAKEKKIIIKLF